MYKLIRKFLFLFDAERTHKLTLSVLDWLEALKILRTFLRKPLSKPANVMGIDFPNPVGLAAGLDKNGDHIDALASCGFGFIEVGTVTPVAQPGNDKPRLFRLTEDVAIINRMGFNNKGVRYLVEQVRRSKRRCVLGINIGKNKSTDNEKAIEDYIECFRLVYPIADYVTINISSPNTPGLRELQLGKQLHDLLFQLKQEQSELRAASSRYVPLVLKIAPDLSEEDIRTLSSTLLSLQVDGVIATNTTNQRPASLSSAHRDESGGLSGAPLTDISNKTLKVLVEELSGQIPVIASGGVMSPSDVREKMRLGASLVQIYTGFIYNGPGLIKKSIQELDRYS